MTTLLSTPVTLNDSTSSTLSEIAGGDLILLVNTASECGLTPQYAGLQQLAGDYGDRGLTIIGAPCNQFGGQEPGTDEEISSFCSLNYGVSFPLLSRLEVNGGGAHPLYRQLTQVADAAGEAGDVQWNFEKFLIAPDGEVIARIRPRTEPQDPEVVSLIEANLPR
ncbi:glutathione peroxidase [Corynebacterium sp. YIM 101645]|uniref:Glutathione peroxidase n=1 Tax=Corynebacterium lemuris TaxID=1859292 RepID=A0ABT2FZH5_9CORY|nr:glutathione peroxidase [Corynebacterium lemuris]MCS5480659.1 glutathione peroxidase [Corynebacterium lemuris]